MGYQVEEQSLNKWPKKDKYVLHVIFPFFPCLGFFLPCLGFFLTTRTRTLVFLPWIIFHTHPKCKGIFLYSCDALEGRKPFLNIKMWMTHITMKNGFNSFEDNLCEPVYVQRIGNYLSIFINGNSNYNFSKAAQRDLVKHTLFENHFVPLSFWWRDLPFAHMVYARSHRPLWDSMG